jgi:hypothetical protein
MGGGDYIASGEGQRFLAFVPAETDSSLRVVVNWLEALNAPPPGR